MNRLITKTFFLLLLCHLFIACDNKSIDKDIILVVAAHPDDEISLGGEILVKYRRLGHKVFVIIATDGKGGVRVTNIQAGDSLGQIRKLESICAAQKMGIETPIFLSIDRLDTKNGIRNYLNGYEQLLLLLKDHISKIDPKVIITYGPDGDSHHSEHIVIGSAVTELILREGWYEKLSLYYLATPSDSAVPYNVGTLSKEYVNVRIEYSDEDELMALDADACFVSQFTKEEREQDFLEKTSNKNNYKYYRKFSVDKSKLKNDLF